MSNISFAVIVIIIVLAIYMFNDKKDKNQQTQIPVAVKTLHKDLIKILRIYCRNQENSFKYKQFSVIASSETRYENEGIYIVVRKNNKEVYDHNTLLGIGIHELSHMIVPSDDNHGKKFINVLMKLKSIARSELSYNSFAEDPSYPLCN